MEYRIIADNCCEIPNHCLKDPKFSYVSSEKPMDAPTVGDYLKCMRRTEGVLIVFTLSADISESYMNAMKARHILIDEAKKAGTTPRKIFVCDSRLVTGGNTQLIPKAMEILNGGFNFSDVTTRLMLFCNRMLMDKRMLAFS